jgi:hypothetical protein
MNLPLARVVSIGSAAPEKHTITARQGLMVSWSAVKNNNPIVLNHASAAGWLLEQYPEASVALAQCPDEPETLAWWDVVRAYLQQVVREESALER